ncbi:phosphoenolpyruvate-protein phosphotransferase [Planctomycetales bacterium]|nr:phosphoenolpyruvate-protein phosphotransferase [Planctomycetales bacterium]GHT00161.1 phosphoenolpyruvate-protein phosphotransferase [Planctomycetales bacterium]GHT05590.1 phosphoenolpyruvate-protein phosphotransferase [Planctomycetales bacterium]
MITLKGKGVSVGIATGKLLFIDRSKFVPERKAITDVAGELQRFAHASKTAQDQLSKLAEEMKEKLGEEHAALFEVHSMMLADTDFTDPIRKIISEEVVCAEYATLRASTVLAQEFADLEDEYMSARAADVRDVAKRVIAVLSGAPVDPTSGPEQVILATDDFTPSETAQFDRSKVLALVSQAGAANSHTAIFARTMNIPAIIGLGASLSAGLSGLPVAVDGEGGELYVEPDADVVTRLQEKAAKIKGERAQLEQYRGKPTVTKSGKKIKLYANIGSAKDADSAVNNDAEGVGLFRSEFLYLGRDDYPDEMVQFESYKTVAERLNGKLVVIRTLDIGADKQADYFKLPHEENPALGMRAIRICLTRKDLFKTQLRALYRASAFGNVAIMFPMISSVKELLQAKTITAEVRAELTEKNIKFNPDTPIGIMVETPASAIISDQLAREADFFSIGTNDLTQYTLAVDRQNESISEFVDTHHEAILRLIQMTVDNAHKAGIWAGICGSLGADPTLTQRFVDMGIDELSVEPSAILRLRSRINEMA